jgi:hypothetical protein
MGFGCEPFDFPHVILVEEACGKHDVEFLGMQTLDAMHDGNSDT